jgi:hypothetical protein
MTLALRDADDIKSTSLQRHAAHLLRRWWLGEQNFCAWFARRLSGWDPSLQHPHVPRCLLHE